ncbi:MAG: biopolymer transporter ExbD [Longimicrobiales bacterium]|nr:biopolymer transporter ExbD [Longimicrobiales bacterium]
MQKSGFVVRFVDVVLILLFGFISISSVRATEIELPESTETPAPPPEIEEVVFVAIRADGTYLVDDERIEIRGVQNLLDFVADQLDQMGDIPVKVRIRASHDTPMRYLVDAARVCDELGVDKALEVRMAVED